MPDDALARELLALAHKIALEAGALLAERAGLARERVGTKSSLTDMVTEVDHASEALIVRHILAARPEDGILGEEGTERTGTSGVRWVVDPLDGTTNYVYGIPAYAISIGVETGGAVVAGVVHDAARGETFAARKGGGATLNGVPIAVSGKSDLATALVATGFGYSPSARAAQGAALARILPQVRDIRRMGSAALDLCWVACGRLDAYFEEGLNEWDLAAGALIVEEADGKVTAFDGKPARRGSVIAAAPVIAESLRRLVVEVGLPSA